MNTLQELNPKYESIEKLEKILDCIKQAQRRISVCNEMILLYKGLDNSFLFPFKKPILREIAKIESLKKAQIKLRKYYNKNLELMKYE
jgi:hypothetical protein